MIRIFIADDHAMFRDGVRRILSMQSGMHFSGEAENGGELLRRARQERWDVLLLDLGLQDIHGLEVIKQIRPIQPDLNILVLTMYPEEQYAARVFRAGGNGYINKGSRGKELVDAIQQVYANGFYGSADAQKLFAEMDNSPDSPMHEQLSDREYEVFMLTAEGKSTSEIASELKLVASTVSTYRKRIIEKLGLRNARDIVKYAIENDLLA